MKIKLTLDEKYQFVVLHIIKIGVLGNDDFQTVIKKWQPLIDDLSSEWFGNVHNASRYKVIERIHSADGIEWIEPKYNWRLKSEKFVSRYISSQNDLIEFYDKPYGDDVMTESELKKLLEGTGLPFEAFEKVEADED